MKHDWESIHLDLWGECPNTVIMMKSHENSDESYKSLPAIQCRCCGVILATSEAPPFEVLDDLGIGDCDIVVTEHVMNT